MWVTTGETPDGLEPCVLATLSLILWLWAGPIPCVCLSFPRCTKSGCYVDGWGPSISLIPRPTGLMTSRQGARRTQAQVTIALPHTPQTPGLGLCWQGQKADWLLSRPHMPLSSTTARCTPARDDNPFPQSLPLVLSPLPSLLSLMGTWWGWGMASESLQFQPQGGVALGRRKDKKALLH